MVQHLRAEHLIVIGTDAAIRQNLRHLTNTKASRLKSECSLLAFAFTQIAVFQSPLS
jgi:hypothetical protein